MLDLVPLLNLAKNFGVNLDLMKKVSEQLTPQTKPAADKLAEVLDELAKMVGALDDEIVRYLSLYFDSEETIIRGRSVLLGLEVGHSMIRMNEARGHCHRIGNIYEKHLKRWFHAVLDSNEASQLEWLFGKFDNR